VLPDLVTSSTGLWFSGIMASVCAVLCLWGAGLGDMRHRLPRILVAVSVAVIATTYWLDIFTDTDATIDMRRGAGWVLWPSLAWTAWTGVRYSRRIVAAQVAAVEELQEILDEE
jgi:hypothetical protein